MRTLSALVGLLAAACASPPSPAPVELASGAAERPVLVQYRAEDTSKIRLGTPYGGVLTQRGACLGLEVEGRFVTVIWPETARLSFDARGLLLRDEQSKARLRLGDTLVGSGGPLPAGAQQSLGASTLSTDMPVECARYPGYSSWIGLVSPAFRKQPLRR